MENSEQCYLAKKIIDSAQKREIDHNSITYEPEDPFHSLEKLVDADYISGNKNIKNEASLLFTDTIEKFITLEFWKQSKKLQMMNHVQCRSVSKFFLI